MRRWQALGLRAIVFGLVWAACAFDLVPSLSVPSNIQAAVIPVRLKICRPVMVVL